MNLAMFNDHDDDEQKWLAIGIPNQLILLSLRIIRCREIRSLVTVTPVIFVVEFTTAKLVEVVTLSIVTCFFLASLGCIDHPLDSCSACLGLSSAR